MNKTMALGDLDWPWHRRFPLDGRPGCHKHSSPLSLRTENKTMGISVNKTMGISVNKTMVISLNKTMVISVKWKKNTPL